MPAPPRMSATSEELAAQAEELQASIAFFRVDSSAGGSKAAKKPAARPAAKPALTIRLPTSASRRMARRLRRRPSPQRQTVKAQQEAARGFALDLDMGGPDADDADFRESA